MTPQPAQSGDPGDRDWYRRWFGEDYLALYPHRSDDEARTAVDLLASQLGTPPSGRVLDLACGAGRHLVALVERGYPSYGLDLSPVMLDHARRRLPGVPMVLGDIRSLPFPDQSFAVVTSFFTSFGYFESDTEDHRVLKEASRVLRKGGHFLLDFLNATEVRRRLGESDEETTLTRGSTTVTQRRVLTEGGRVVEKRILLEGVGPPRNSLERVRLHPPGVLRDAMRKSGLEPLASFGDYHGSPFTPESPRFVVFAQAV